MQTGKVTLGMLGALVGALGLTAPAARADATYNGKTKDEIKEMVSATERQSNTLRKVLEDRLNEGLLAKTEKQGVAKKRVQLLDERLERLARDLDRTKDPSTIRMGVKETVQLARPVQAMFNRNVAARRTVDGSWVELKGDINRLAAFYHVPRIGR